MAKKPKAKEPEAKKPTKYIVTDGELTLELERDEEVGGYSVTSPFNPDIITQGETLEEVFEMARDVIQMYKDYRAEQQSEPTDPAKPVKRAGRSNGAKKTA